MNTNTDTTAAKPLTNEDIADMQKLARQAAADYCKAKGITRGLSKGAHAGAMVHALVDSGVLNEDVKLEAFHILCALENGSQLRQELEKVGVLGKDAMVRDYAP